MYDKKNILNYEDQEDFAMGIPQVYIPRTHSGTGHVLSLSGIPGPRITIVMILDTT